MIETVAYPPLFAVDSPKEADERFLRRILVFMIAGTLGCAAMVATLAVGPGWDAPAHIVAILAQ